MNELYRKFDSGRYGFTGVDGSIYQTQIEGAEGVSGNSSNKKKKKHEQTETDTNKVEPVDMYSSDFTE